MTALRSLTENVQGEANEPRMQRRQHLLDAGAVPKLVALVAYDPRLPAPKVVGGSVRACGCG